MPKAPFSFEKSVKTFKKDIAKNTADLDNSYNKSLKATIDLRKSELKDQVNFNMQYSNFYGLGAHEINKNIVNSSVFGAPLGKSRKVYKDLNTNFSARSKSIQDQAKKVYDDGYNKQRKTQAEQDAARQKA